MTPDEHAAVADIIAAHPATGRTDKIYKLRRDAAAELDIDTDELAQYAGDTRSEQRQAKKVKRELLKKLAAIDHDGVHVSLTRRDPGDTGPLLMQIHGPDIDELYEIADDGTATKIEVNA